jgi:hypothetical protein
VFVHIEPHSVSEVPVPHDEPQLPPAQYCPGAQAVPHDPQWAGSFCVLVQMPPQFVIDVAHATSHRPATHDCPAGHALEHVPQFALSDCTFAHMPAHSICVDVHRAVHTPETQL